MYEEELPMAGTSSGKSSISTQRLTRTASKGSSTTRSDWPKSNASH